MRLMTRIVNCWGLAREFRWNRNYRQIQDFHRWGFGIKFCLDLLMQHSDALLLPRARGSIASCPSSPHIARLRTLYWPMLSALASLARESWGAEKLKTRKFENAKTRVAVRVQTCLRSSRSLGSSLLPLFQYHHPHCSDLGQPQVFGSNSQRL